ncbi:shikimate kinase [Metabacillus endolithicus]|uniref:shikimate kinase n=1 Tax=Metabacillus endolithicus TaxID=1535204 RepID=UPI001FFBCEAC|nr:shikimate kinase [Metabacillus endolithicus]UPG64532.1 shikimate kinase [Metabacillus endolithicus]
MEAIYLTGFMGAGKTTVGQQLAQNMKLPVIDTDQEIVKKLNKSIKEIFEENGEAFFRDQETKILKELPTKDVIITTGGGIVIKDENRELWMKEHGNIVMLHADIDTIYERVSSDKTRPLASKKSKQELNDLYQSRVNFYDDCTILIETDQKNIEDIVNEISIRLNSKNFGNK